MNKQEEVMLKDLRPGAVFVTRDGTYAVKSEYFYTGDSQSQCQCVLLASGEYAHFRDGNETLVREASVAGLAKSVTGPSTELSTERDTHFANWASSVWDELHTLCTRKIDEADKERYEAMDKAIIARAGYDLVYFLLDKAEYHSGDNSPSFLPDMTEWPRDEGGRAMNWEALTPDERDWLIHEVVILGRKWTHEPVVCPAYTQSMDAAWEVVRRMNNSDSPTFHSYQGYADFIDALEKIVGSTMFFDLFYCDKDGDHLTPERICKAALQAVGVEI